MFSAITFVLSVLLVFAFLYLVSWYVSKRDPLFWFIVFLIALRAFAFAMAALMWLALRKLPGEFSAKLSEGRGEFASRWAAQEAK